MEDIIRKLTHDNRKFNSEWNKIEKELEEKCYQGNISSILDALAEYVLQEPQTPCPSEMKFTFVTHVIDALDYRNKKKSNKSLFDHVFQVFIRVFDQGQIDQWHLGFLKELYWHFEMREYLSKRILLIEQLLLSLQKHPFTLTSKNQSILESWEHFWCYDIFDSNLLDEKIFETMKEKFQQLCQFAARNSSSSPFWSKITSHLIDNLPELFNSYFNPTDAKIDLEIYCFTKNSDYKKLIRERFSNQVNLFKANYPQVVLTIENLLLKNNIEEAEYFFDDVLLKHISAIPDLELLLQMFIRISPKISIEQREEFTRRILSNLSSKLKEVKVNKKLWPLFINLAIVALELHTSEGPFCADELLIKENFYPWKELGERLGKIIYLCGSYDDFILSEQSYFNKFDNLQDILSTIYDRAKVNNNLFRETHSHALKYSLRWASPPQKSDANKQQWTIHVYKMGIFMINLIDRKQITLDIYSQLLQKLYIRLQLEEDIDDETEGTEQEFFIKLTECLSIYTEILKTLSSSIHNTLNSIFLIILDQSRQNEDGSTSFGHVIFDRLWSEFSETIITEKDARIYEPSVSKLYTVARNEEKQETDLFQCWSTFWNTVGVRFPQIAINQIETLLDEFIDRDQIGFMFLLQNVYPQRPEPFHARINKIIQVSFQNNNIKQSRGVYLVLLQTIGKHHPEIISSAHTDFIFTSLSTIQPKLNDAELHGLFQFLTPVASVQPNLFDKHQKDMIRIAIETQNTSVFYCLQKYFISSTIINGKNVAKDHLDKIISLLQRKDGCTQDNRDLMIHACELIGIRHKQIVEEKRPIFVALSCLQLVHFIDNTKMTKENQQVLEQSRQEIEIIERKVQKTKTDIQQVKSTVKRQELNITNMKAHVGTINTQLQDVTQRVDIHQKEIERIDAKTLSYVPVWASDVCKLLNRRTSNDWRLLGRRFGYSSSELRHWASQVDPCMALLNEWYMTHKTDEATFGLVKVLKEIGRKDVEDIIQKAVKNAGETIPDEITDFDIHRLPPIFLSYQWNSQAMVSQLKGRLEEAGYSCWMDVGHMGGGSKLHSKIDKGIRGAKVVLCCMNKDYGKSDSCVGQVNLAISTGKPLIPIQMEKQTWPPEGALGPLMSEYLFIRFFDRKATNDPNFWPDDKFSELLGQIRYYVAPDPDMISERYKDWFVPRVENLIFLKQPNKETTKMQHGTQSSLADIPLLISHPQIMISYQWDRQSDILALYKRLTELGYRVWLDIFQMGGGDSLFAKIDEGIRNAQCVLACITPKYTLSTNCRREMSLADALGKPIIPLLLEQLNEDWPPVGPMALVFTGKVYIDFRSHQNNNIWQGKEYDQILVKLKQLISDVQNENPKEHLVDVKRSSSSAARLNKTTITTTSTLSVKPIDSAPITVRSRTCSII
ncbi:unnamed protein product [Rotaria sordida]|uniref:Death domain-containing protein n=1 Tax=Rotaria sordida TaxID=392033 RepID=A0A815BV44_9BILA|nr:unnamed protein product [Rotaria sordida]